ELDLRGRGQQLFEEHPALEAGKVGAEAEVFGDAEGQMRVGIAADVEALWVGEHVLVAVGRRIEHRHLLARGDLGTRELGVLCRRPPEVMERVSPPQDLLDRARKQRRVRTYVDQLVWMGQQRM